MDRRKGSKTPDFGYSVNADKISAYKAKIRAYNKRIANASKGVSTELASKLPKKVSLTELATRATSERQLDEEIEQLEQYKRQGLKFEVRETQVKTRAEWAQIDKAIEEENRRREIREAESQEKQMARNAFRTQKMRDAEPMDLKQFLAEKPERQEQLIRGGYVFDWADPRLVDFQQRWIATLSLNSSVAMMRWPDRANEFGGAFLDAMQLATSMEPEEFYKRFKAFPELGFETVSDPDELLKFIESIVSLLS